ncbi:Protein FAR1-RELATED SEQUENCE 12 [Acorus gramineus]|uniref:Protein FAR1-RELATED SEQUENCE 12 n=1 Tax=Acorus gramineus TaxID=55184 RepID=A0AAV9BUA2_ACOGR|nr:Protein FAR1-RELATED SEQUENCE 12 [Acorus gramineus]
MQFDSAEEANNFYTQYNKQVGFRIQKNSTKTVNAIIQKRQYVCSREGFRKNDRLEKSVRVQRAETRCGCHAKFTIQRQLNGKLRFRDLSQPIIMM